LRIAVGLAWLVIAAEIVMSGIVGFLSGKLYQNNNVSEVILALIYIGVVGLVLDKFMAWIETRLPQEPS